MKDRADELRRRIATYRRQLAENSDMHLARLYLSELAKAHAELDEIEGEDDGIAPKDSRR